MVLRSLEVMGEGCKSIWHYRLENHNLLCHFGGSSEKQKAKRHVGSRRPRPHEVSEGMRPLWPGLETIHAWHILAKNRQQFACILKTLTKLNSKVMDSFGRGNFKTR